MKIKKILAILLVMLLAVSMMGASKTPAKVTGVKAVTATESAIGISWKAAKYAKKYELQYKASTAKKWKSVKTSAKKATVKSLKQNTKYQFKVRGINGSKKGSFSATITQKTYIKPAKVNDQSIFALERSFNEIKIQWAAAKNASTYEVATTRLNSDNTDYQSCEYEQIDDNHYKPTTHFTTTSYLRPNTWYEFKVRSVYNKTGKFKVIRSAWSKPFYACTTTGNRVITGEKTNGVFHYTMNDAFVVGVDDALAPTGVYEITDYTETYYNTDYMNVNSISFPANFYDLSDDDTGMEGYLSGKTISVGDTLEEKTIKNIFIEPGVSDYGPTSAISVQFQFTDNQYSTPINW